MQTCIKKFKDQASTTLAALAAEVKNNIDRPLISQNPALYYGHLHMKYYYFCQQYKDHFEVAGSLGHKNILFAAGFLNDCILNRWQ